MKFLRSIVLAVLCLFAGTAFAHTGGHAVTGFVSGLTHPLMGLDHLFAMIAIGLWAAQQGRQMRLAVPAAFVGVMILGVMLAWSGFALPHVETAIALSVLVLGLLIIAGRQWTVEAGVAIAAGFALFHGYAHGQEMPLAASPESYSLGFVLATLGLHGLGIVGGLLDRSGMQAAGTGIAAAGLALIFTT